MKKLSIYAILVSIAITLMYSWNITQVENILDFSRATSIAFISEIGLWCTYYYARDYEVIKAHETRSKQLNAFLQKAE